MSSFGFYINGRFNAKIVIFLKEEHRLKIQVSLMTLHKLQWLYNQ
jgi:hypothetical protein